MPTHPRDQQAAVGSAAAEVPHQRGQHTLPQEGMRWPRKGQQPLPLLPPPPMVRVASTAGFLIFLIYMACSRAWVAKGGH